LIKTSLLLFCYLIFSGCSTSPTTDISQTALLSQIENNTVPVIIDVRSTSEYQSGHIKGALHLPFYQTLSSEKLKKYNKDQCFILYCEHGPRAGLSKMGLKILGFKCIRYLEGHMKAWKAAKLPIKKAQYQK